MMKRDLLKTTILTAVLVAWMAGLPGAVPAAGTPAVKQKVELLFVQNAKGVAIDKAKRTLTLKGVGATTLFFSDRPVRMAGHYSMKEYLEFWTEGKDSFDADPPNATLSVFEPGQDDLLDVVVKLQNPRLQGDDLIYDITLIEGQVAQGGWTVLAVHRHLRRLAPHGPARGMGQRGCCDQRGSQCGCCCGHSSHYRHGE